MRNSPIPAVVPSLPYTRQFKAGDLPERFDTVQAAVLAFLLSGEAILSDYNAWQQCETHCLSKEIHRLEKDLGWTVERVKFVHRCRGGGEIAATGYQFSKAVLKDAQDLYGSTWTDTVRTYRELRKQAAEKLKLLQVLKYLADEKPAKLAGFQNLLRLAGML